MKFYRYERLASWFNFYPTELQLVEFDLVKETPCGYWIKQSSWLFYDLPNKWVSKTGRKRYAYPTKEEALKSFFFKKKRQIKILQTQLDFAKNDLKIAESMMNKESVSNEI